MFDTPVCQSWFDSIGIEFDCKKKFIAAVPNERANDIRQLFA